MTRKELIDRYRHELCGLISDAATTPTKGADLAQRFRLWFNRVDEILGQIHHDMTKPAENGLKVAK